MDSFEGKLAVVTGGGAGIGRELVRQLAAAGCSVAILDLDAAAMAATIELVAAEAPAGVALTAHACDVADAAAVERCRDEVLARHRADHVDLLFNNAGIVGGDSFLSADRAAWERVFGICWGGVYNCSRAFVPLLVASPEACLVNTSSMLGFWASNGPASPASAYATAKFAVKGFSESLIDDFRANAPHVRVVTVMPGVIGTGIGGNSVRALGADEAEATREMLAGLDVPLDGIGAAEVAELTAIVDETFAEFAPTTPGQAAATILAAVREGRWRVLIGEDAVRLDEAVRKAPEQAYEPGFPGPGSGFESIVLMRIRFATKPDPGLEASVELRLGGEPIALRAAAGRLSASRGPAAAPAAALATDPATLIAILSGDSTLPQALARKAASVEGDREQLERLLAAVA